VTKEIGRLLTAMITPFKADGAVDYDRRPRSWRSCSSTTARTASSSQAPQVSRRASATRRRSSC